MITTLTPLAGLIGGALIGLAAVILMAGTGRILGASGIVGGLFSGRFDADFQWRALFVVGLLAGGALAGYGGAFDRSSLVTVSGPALTIAGGLLVGIGTALGSGCTSGHGICGMSRLSTRSIVATVVFMATAILTVTILRHLIGA